MGALGNTVGFDVAEAGDGVFVQAGGGVGEHQMRVGGGIAEPVAVVVQGNPVAGGQAAFGQVVADLDFAGVQAGLGTPGGIQVAVAVVGGAAVDALSDAGAEVLPEQVEGKVFAPG